MIVAMLLIASAGLLSAFCSGVETGLYRVPRVRLVLDAVDGSRVARGLLWLTNHPGLFVSTLLVGNTVANYAVPVGIAWFVIELFSYDDPRINIAVSILITPILFIFCELLPKSLFHQIPNRLLRTAGWPLFALTVFALPLTWALYVLSRWLQRVLGEEPLKIRPALARRELRQVLEEGEQAGLLESVQRDLVQNMFAYGSDPISRYCMPLRGFEPCKLIFQSRKPNKCCSSRISRFCRCCTREKSDWLVTTRRPIFFIQRIDPGLEPFPPLKRAQGKLQS